MGVGETVASCLQTVGEGYQEAYPQAPLRLLDSEPETNWHKLDHLLYLPLLGLTRPCDLYYYQGEGLKVLYGFTYKYLPLEHFLGQLSRLRVGYPLAEALAQCYSQAWYPGAHPLFLFADWHVKPHWTKHPAHSGHVTMWERIMPGTKQLILNGPAGHLLGGWDYAVDTHLTQVLVELEADLATQLQRPIAYAIFDSEGGGQPLAERYAQAGRYYLSVLPRQGAQRLTAFDVLGPWEAVRGDPDHEAAEARWQDAPKAQADPRRLVLLRRLGDTDPTRVYAGLIPPELAAGEVPGRFRQRWQYQERVIRQLVNGANLNANFGYAYQEVPSRTQRRRWEEAQGRVEVTERQLAAQEEALVNRWGQLTQLRAAWRQEQQALDQAEAQLTLELTQRQARGQRLRRCQQRLRQHEQRRAAQMTRFQKRRRRLLRALVAGRRRRNELRREACERRALREAIDTTSLCRERDLEKDQVMLDLQVLLASLHDWARNHYFAAPWQNLELDTATALVYRKPGRVRWGPEEIEVVLDPYRYPEQQQAMAESCSRFNAAQVRWRDGRRLRIQVAPAPERPAAGTVPRWQDGRRLRIGKAQELSLQLCGCQSAVPT
jgi:hypothetical protein